MSEISGFGEIVAVDIGATKTVVAKLRDGAIEPVARFATAQDPEQAANNIVEAVFALEDGASIKAVGIGCPGPLDPKSGTILEPPNLRKWWGFGLADYLEGRLNTKVTVENDANLGALGEAVYGSGRGYDSLFYLTLSTGIGAGYIVDGKIIGGHRGLAGEVYAVDPGWFSGNPTGNTMLEIASGPGLIRTTKKLLESGRKSSLSLEGLDTHTLLAALDNGDKVAVEVVEAARDGIAGLVLSVVLTAAPETIVLAGGLCTESRWFVDPIRRKVADWMPIPAFADIPISRAELWDRAVLYGAIVLAETG